MLLGSARERDIELSDDGFLVNFNDWEPEVAQMLAEEDDLELVECHWAALNFIRQYYREFQVPPSPKIIVQEVGSQLGPERCSFKTLARLFPLGGGRHACRLAGLPIAYCHAC